MCKTQQRILSTLSYYKRVVRGITNTSMRKNPHYVSSYIFLEYLHRRFQRLSKQDLKWITLPDMALRRVLDDPGIIWNEYVDCDSCALANVQLSRESTSSPSWFNVCSMASMAKYKLMIISVPDINENTVLISETMERNLRNALHCEQLDGCFIRKYTYLTRFPI